MENGNETKEPTIGELVNAYMGLHDVIVNAETDKRAIEAKLKAAGIRVPGMARTRKPKAVVTRSRKMKNNGAQVADGSAAQ